MRHMKIGVAEVPLGNAQDLMNPPCSQQRVLLLLLVFSGCVRTLFILHSILVLKRSLCLLQGSEPCLTALI